jgi:hypothetical protein
LAPAVSTPTAEHASAGHAPEATPADAAVAAPAQRAPTLIVVLALVLVVGVMPLVAAVLALRRPQWYPVGDLAMTELRVRDVGSAHPPLVGLPGRINAFGQRGSHPGPLSFWALAPVYRLFGSSSWALTASTAVLNVVALGTAVAIAARRAGPRVALGTAAGLALLAHAYGAETLTQPWNPYLPIVWWVVFLLAVWSVLCDDLPLLPVAVVVGTLCLQTHVSYAGLVAGMGAGAGVALAVTAWKRREPARRRPVLVWGGLSAGLLTVLWLPVAVQQVTNSPGNLAIIGESFSRPTRGPIGVAQGAEIWLTRLDLGGLLIARQALDGSPLPGLALLAAWAVAAVVAWRRHDRSLVRLHAVVGGALVLGLVSASRILGQPIYYLVLWMWGTTIVAAVATAWTAVVAALDTAARRGVRGRTLAMLRARATAAAAVVMLAGAAALTLDAASAEPPAASVSRVIGLLAQDTIGAIEAGTAPGGGPDGRYLLRWEDLELPQGHADGLLLELERHGLSVGVDDAHSLLDGDHRVMRPSDATAVVTFVEGANALARWRDDPTAVEVASAAPTPADAAEFDRLQRESSATLRADGLDVLADRLDVGNMWGVLVDERLPARVLPPLMRMVELGLPAAMFIAPATP